MPPAAAAAATSAAVNRHSTTAGTQPPLLPPAEGSPRHAAPIEHSESSPAVELSTSRKRRRSDTSSAAHIGRTGSGQTAAHARGSDLLHSSLARYQDQEREPALSALVSTERAAKVQRLESPGHAAMAAAGATAAASAPVSNAATTAAEISIASDNAGAGTRISGHSNAPAPPSAAEGPATDWQRLYASGNGWKAPRFHQWHFPPDAHKVIVGATLLHGVAGHQDWHRSQPCTYLEVAISSQVQASQQEPPAAVRFVQQGLVLDSTAACCAGALRLCVVAGCGARRGTRAGVGHRGCGAAGLLRPHRRL